ncbi:MAG: multiheme c-type cytochrome [Planctomycetaceae bacterium]
MWPGSNQFALFISVAAICGLIAFSMSCHLPGHPNADYRGDVISQTGGWADESSCAECHNQSDEFSKTGHANTLRRAETPASRALLSKLSECEAALAEGTRVIDEGDQLIAETSPDAVLHRLKLDWCFGSGMHATTWVSTLPDSHGNTDTLEYRWTWFTSLQGFAVTPGQPAQRGDSSVSVHGLLFDGSKARRCFSCHSTVLPVSSGQIEEDGIHPGVTCQRCHGPREEHVRSEGEIHPVGWTTSDRMESVRRCAVCHRLPEERPAADIRPDNPAIVRFQPMGLQQSACFLKSEMRCTTCHDPHRPMDAQDSAGIWQCLQCHNPEDDTHTLCGLGRNDDCLRCHMPAVQMEFPVKFTDHWIRVLKQPAESLQ